MENRANKKTDCENVLLVASFGTTSAESRRLDIAPVEEAVRAAAGGEWSVRRCFSSGMVIDIIEKREGVRTDSIETAIEKALLEGARRLAVQPTHLMRGLEYEKLKRILDGYAGAFERISLGDPLLTSEDDLGRVSDALIEASSEYDDRKTALVFMGHGTDAASNRVYTEMQKTLSEKGKSTYYIGTAEAEPSLDDVTDAVTAGPCSCDIHNIPMASNLATAELLIKSLDRGDFEWRELYR